eukprot:Colp12_sorted_trinity150504_noHs@19078
MYKQVLKEGIAQPLTLGIYRSDYMLDVAHSEVPVIKQVELNTIAASFGCLGTITSRLHRTLLQRFDVLGGKLEQSPLNSAMESLADAMGEAVKLYGKPGAIALMVVQPNERNAFDQRWLEFALFERHGVVLLRRTLLELAERASLVGEERALIMDGQEVALAYFRAGYAPTDYPSGREWAGRLLVERSLAIKCPSLPHHLAGAKKVQQVLADPEVLNRYAPPGKQDCCSRRSQDCTPWMKGRGGRPLLLWPSKSPTSTSSSLRERAGAITCMGSS